MQGYKSFMKKLSKEEKVGLNDNQLRIIYAKYLMRDKDGNIIETPLTMFKRIAKEIAKPESRYKSEEEVKKIENQFFDMMINLEFLPGGRTIANAGTPVKNLANCFVLPVEDSMEGIFEAVKKAALIQKRGGGVGYCFSTLRSNGSWVSGCSGIASGPLSFMRVFDVMCSTIMQGNRRGAQMATFHVSHPDIELFVGAKDDLTQLTNFNISVMLDDEFMKAVEEDGKYKLIDPHSKKVTKTVKAKELFDKIAYHAWKTGEPGVLFNDTANRFNTVKHLGEFKATNPCAEIWLLDYEVCNLGSINLDRMTKVNDGKIEVDWDKLKLTAGKATRFLDNVIDAGEYPAEEITEMAQKTRRIGLGIMGFADLLFQLRVPYSSQEGRDMAEKIMKTISDESWRMSEELAKEKGVFPAWEGSSFEKEDRKVRNCATTAIAPTGTLSMVGNTSGGCEPNFALAFVKNSHSIKEQFTYVNKHFEKIAKDQGFYSEELMEKIAEQGTLDGIDDVPDDVKKIFEVSYNISAEEHILMQAAFQKYISNAVSKTINFPKSATVNQVKEGYMLAWKNGCKGATVYRDGSRDNQVLTVNGKNEAKKEEKMPVAEEKVVVNQESIEELPSQEQLMVMTSTDGSVDAVSTFDITTLKQLTTCPECNIKLVKQEGCVLCPDCGFSACDV